MLASSVGRLSATQWPAVIWSGTMPSRSAATRRMNPAGKKRSSVHKTNLVGMAGQALSRPRAAARGVRLRPASVAHGLLGQGAGNIVVEGDERIPAAGLAAVSRSLLGDGLPQAGAGGPVLGLFSGGRDHAGDQDDRPGSQPGGGQ